MNKNEDQNFEFEVDVEGVHPHNVDAISFLNYAVSYLEGLRAIAKLSDGELKFTGLEIVDKCIAVRSQTNNADLGWAAASQLDNYVAGSVKPPRKLGLITMTRDVIEMRERFSATLPKSLRGTVKTRVRFGKRVTELRQTPNVTGRQDFKYRTIESFRAKVVSLAETDLKVRLLPVVGKGFVVALASPDLAKQVRHHWLDEVDVDVEVERSLGGDILKGKLLRFHNLNDDGGISTWREWVNKNDPAVDLDEVDDA